MSYEDARKKALQAIIIGKFDAYMILDSDCFSLITVVEDHHKEIAETLRRARKETSSHTDNIARLTRPEVVRTAEVEEKLRVHNEYKERMERTMAKMDELKNRNEVAHQIATEPAKEVPETAVFNTDLCTIAELEEFIVKHDIFFAFETDRKEKLQQYVNGAEYQEDRRELKRRQELIVESYFSGFF